MNDEITDLTVEIISAYVSNNPVPLADLPDLITRMYGVLSSLNNETAPAPPSEELKPAVNPKKSVFPGYIVCLEDGKQFQSLKRHLSKLGMTPAEYRAKWSLPADYPMTAPDYSAKRSALAKSLGLGRQLGQRRGGPKKAK